MRLTWIAICFSLIVFSLYGCETSITGNANAIAASCFDSDHGQNFNAQGSVQDATGVVNFDKCIDNDKVQEFYCLDNKIVSVIHDCATGCLDGACQLKEKCIDSDSGFNVFNKGATTGYFGKPGSIKWQTKTDECYSDNGESYLREYICGTSDGKPIIIEQDTYCKYGCSDGACLSTPPKCSETDGGLDYYVKGSVSWSNSYAADSCSGNMLNEVYCNNSVAESVNFACPDGCSDGACISIGNIQPMILRDITHIVSVNPYGVANLGFGVGDVSARYFLGSYHGGTWYEGLNVSDSGPVWVSVNWKRGLTDIVLTDEYLNVRRIYLPGTNPLGNDSYGDEYYWIANDGSSYYATLNHARGWPNLTSAQALKPEHLARAAPEGDGTCYDSDGGKDIFVKGVAVLGNTATEDSCTYCTGACQTDGPCPVVCGAVAEQYCQAWQIHEDDIVCPTGYSCIDSACAKPNNNTCTDFDNSPDYVASPPNYPITEDAYPDLFTSSYAHGTNYAGSSDPSQHITYGTGANPSFAQSTSAPYSTVYDYCDSLGNLVEGTCMADGRLAATGVTCPNGCKDGACISGCRDTYNFTGYLSQSKVRNSCQDSLGVHYSYCQDSTTVVFYSCQLNVNIQINNVSYLNNESEMCTPVQQPQTGTCDNGVYTVGVLNSTCGNNKIDPGEQCDGTNLTLKNCVLWDQYVSGQISCTNCKLDFSACVPKPLTVDLKVNNQRFPAAVPFQGFFNLTWNSTGAERCYAEGSYAPIIGGGTWSSEYYLPFSGSKTLLATDEEGSFENPLNFMVLCRSANYSYKSSTVLVPVYHTLTGTCTDSDSNNYFTNGYTKLSDGSFLNDTCDTGYYGSYTNSNLLMESVCNGSTMKYNGYNCSYGCTRGACRQTECIPKSCDGKCGVIDNCGYSDYCGYCDDGQVCMDNMCINTPDNVSCMDTDLGLNYTVFGRTCNDYACGNDTCMNKLLYERYCDGSMLRTTYYPCPGNCSRGKCI